MTLRWGVALLMLGALSCSRPGPVLSDVAPHRSAFQQIPHRDPR
jgi:hypothetical protein